MQENYIRLFANCIPVRGYSRSLICDLQRSSFYLIPNALEELVSFFDEYCANELLYIYGAEHYQTVKGYLDFLIDNNLAFYCSESERRSFPQLSTLMSSPQKTVSNAIIELDRIDREYLERIINSLDSVNCHHLEVRIIRKITIEELEIIVYQLANREVCLTDIHMIVPSNSFEIDRLKKMFEGNFRLSRLIISAADEESCIGDFFYDSKIFYTKRNVHVQTCCGNFRPEMFIINTEFFIESKNANTCLNKKISIDHNGNIKSCPSMAFSFGNVFKTKLAEVLRYEEFISKSTITKDDIKVCKDCEFRHVCMDCRAYLEVPDDIYSKPLKCGYNPYTMEWDEWQIDPKKKEAIMHYGLVDI